MAMRTGETLEGRRAQKPILQALYPDYDPKRHDVYVIRFNREEEAKAFAEYCKRRGIE